MNVVVAVPVWLQAGDKIVSMVHFVSLQRTERNPVTGFLVIGETIGCDTQDLTMALIQHPYDAIFLHSKEPTFTSGTGTQGLTEAWIWGGVAARTNRPIIDVANLCRDHEQPGDALSCRWIAEDIDFLPLPVRAGQLELNPPQARAPGFYAEVLREQPTVGWWMLVAALRWRAQLMTRVLVQGTMGSQLLKCNRINVEGPPPAAWLSDVAHTAHDATSEPGGGIFQYEILTHWWDRLSSLPGAK